VDAAEDAGPGAAATEVPARDADGAPHGPDRRGGTVPARPRPLHAPYAGRHRPFTIALSPLDPADWLEVDDRREADLAEKAAILAAQPDVVMAEPGMAAAETEARDRIAAHLAARGLPGGPGAPGASPLVEAALMVQDDLVLMRRGPDGWRLASAVLAFPSSWSLREKFGRPMDGIHAAVPGWAGPMGARVARIFDNLAPDAPVWRLNWSLQSGGGLREARPKEVVNHGPDRDPSAALLVRVERQTLVKLPVSGDILFTIKVMLDPVDALAGHPDGARLAAGLAEQLAGLDADQLAYKGLARTRGTVLARLRAVAAAAQERQAAGA
jgi:hypothetical protein